MWPAENIMQSMWPAVLCRFSTPDLTHQVCYRSLSQSKVTTRSVADNYNAKPIACTNRHVTIVAVLVL